MYSQAIANSCSEEEAQLNAEPSDGLGIFAMLAATAVNLIQGHQASQAQHGYLNTQERIARKQTEVARLAAEAEERRQRLQAGGLAARSGVLKQVGLYGGLAAVLILGMFYAFKK
jgi:hypothetical protein